MERERKTKLEVLLARMSENIAGEVQRQLEGLKEELHQLDKSAQIKAIEEAVRGNDSWAKDTSVYRQKGTTTFNNRLPIDRESSEFRGAKQKFKETKQEFRGAKQEFKGAKQNSRRALINSKNLIFSEEELGLSAPFKEREKITLGDEVKESNEPVSVRERRLCVKVRFGELRYKAVVASGPELAVISSETFKEARINTNIGGNLLFGEETINLDTLYPESEKLVLGDTKIDGEEKIIEENKQKERRSVKSLARYNNNMEKEHRLDKKIGGHNVNGKICVRKTKGIKKSGINRPVTKRKVTTSRREVTKEFWDWNKKRTSGKVDPSSRDLEQVCNTVRKTTVIVQDKYDGNLFRLKNVQNNNETLEEAENSYAKGRQQGGDLIYNLRNNANKLKYIRKGTAIHFYNKIKYKKGNEVLKARKKVRLRALGLKTDM